MLRELAKLDPDLRRAGYTLSIAVVGGALLALLLYQTGFVFLAILFVWVANLPAAWFLSQAARLQGRNAWLAGLSSIVPAFALLEFFMLCPGSPRARQASPE